MRYAILGTTQAFRDDGTPVPVGGPRLRALLAALALRGGRPVPNSALIDEIWAEDPPAEPADALQTLVARLRRALGRDEVASAPDGYRLTSPDTDLARFTALTREARAEPDPARRLRLLREALALHRGPALADLPSRPDAAARAESERQAALRDRLDAELSLGHAASLLPELAELCRAHPLDEPLHALLLRALHSAHRVPEALTAYESFRRTLRDTLGSTPGPALRTLHTALLDDTPPQDPHLPADPPGGAGPAPQDAPRAGNIKPRLTSFVGRSAELGALQGELTQTRLLTLTGPGGSGKTRLALELADAHPEGAWLIELAPVEAPHATVRTLAHAALTALGLRDTAALHVSEASTGSVPDTDPLHRLTEELRTRNALLVLDNCEHLLAPAAALAEELLAHCPGVAVLATSREPLGIPGEQVHPVEPLPEPAAVRLLTDRASREPDPATAAEICRRLDGLPLAIELAAARLRSLTPRQLADRLDRRFALLTSGNRTALPRQQTLRAVVEWSWDLLDDPERALLRRLSVFSGGCTLEAAEQICADEVLPAEDIAPTLAALADKSLVLADLTDRRPHYRMLETIHAYARERLDEAGDPERARTLRRHLRHYRELARTTDPLLRSGDQLHHLSVLEAERDNLRAALRRAVAAGEEQEALCLVHAQAWYWSLRDYATETHDWCRAVAALGPDPLPAEDLDAPRPTARQPVDLPPPWPPEVLAEARRGLRVLLLVTDEAGFTRVPGDDRVRLGHALFDAYRSGLPQSARFPGLVRVYLIMYAGVVERLQEICEDLVACCREHGRTWELAFALQTRAKLLSDLGDLGDLSDQGGQGDQGDAPETVGRARRDAEESLRLFTATGDRWGIAQATAALAEEAAYRADFPAAVAYWRRALDLAQEVGSSQDIPLLRARLGDALLASGEMAAGEREIREGIAAAGSGMNGQGARFYGTVILASHLGSRDRLAEARALLEGLVPDGGGPMSSVFGAILDGSLAWIEGREGAPAKAMRRLRAAYAAVAEHPLSGLMGPQIAYVLLPFAIVLLHSCARSEDPAEPAAARRAATLLGVFDARQLRVRVHHLTRAELVEAERGLRELLGGEAFSAAYEAGAALPPAGESALLG